MYRFEILSPLPGTKLKSGVASGLRDKQNVHLRADEACNPIKLSVWQTIGVYPSHAEANKMG